MSPILSVSRGQKYLLICNNDVKYAQHYNIESVNCLELCQLSIESVKLSLFSLSTEENESFQEKTGLF